VARQTAHIINEVNFVENYGVSRWPPAARAPARRVICRRVKLLWLAELDIEFEIGEQYIDGCLQAVIDGELTPSGLNGPAGEAFENAASQAPDRLRRGRQT
jgi:hypothetical protein